LYPLLNYVFFDEGSSELPSRYKTLSKAQTSMFSDTTIPGGTLDKYYHILNIYGFRLNKHPEVKITVLGTNDNKSEKEKGNTNLSKARATLVYNYLRDVWGISEDRMKLEFTNLSPNASQTKVSDDRDLADEENRRVELLTDEWEVKKPVFETDPKIYPQPELMKFKLENGIEDAIVANRRLEVTRGGKPWNTFTEIGTTEGEYVWNWQNTDLEYPTDEVPFTAQLIVTTKSGAECKSDPINIPVKQVSSRERIVTTGSDSTDEKYSLILFPFNRFDAGPFNERILKDYVYNRVTPESKVTVIGHTDVVGLENHNQKLSERRANTVSTGIKQKSKQIGELNSVGVGESDPLYPNELPEGRLYNRTIQVLIKTPLKQ
jgi:outer membrane protein OmpA-like peptidoglycan-associated protein